MDAQSWLSQKPIIGMLHLLPLPGSPLASRYGHKPEVIMAAVLERALADAAALTAGGCHALMMENFGDTPFFPRRVPAVTVAAMARVAAAVKAEHKVPLGINVLRNDGQSALAVAVAAGADFIRVNVLNGARVSDQGLIEGIAHSLLRERAALGAHHIAILADVDVKHSAALASRPVGDEAKDLVLRGLADGLIVSGSGTGAAVDPAKLQTVYNALRQVAPQCPVLLGSGVDAGNLASLSPYADGFIVGTALKEDGHVGAVVDPARVKALLAVHKQISGSHGKSKGKS